MRFNGIDPRTLHAGISIAKEIPPGSPTSQLETLAGSSGEIVTGRTLQQGEYLVRVNIGGKTRPDAWTMRRILAAWAMSTSVTTHELIPTHWPTVAYDAILSEIEPPEFTFGFGTIDVSFAVPRPIAHDLQWSVATGSASARMPVGGTSYARPRITITTTEAEGLTIAVDGEVYAALTGSFAEGQTVEVDTITAAVLIDGVHHEDRIDYMQTDFRRLQEACAPGAHTVACAGASAVGVRWRNEWL